jgi:oxygen-independent coproporphyrinogen-3 oxidase
MDDGRVGVYVHVPWCERVCPYCDFAVVAARALDGAIAGRYVDALLAELERRARTFAGRGLASLYLGGGTPSLLPPEQVARIADAVGRAFPAAGPVETTLEVNPSTLERQRLPDFRDAGVSRVSVGVQSFDDTTLRRLGRAHRAQEAHRTLEACRRAGFDAVSLDLIFAAPGQRPADFERDLDAALDFAPEHISTYELTLEPGTPFHAAAARGRLHLPPEDDALAMHGSAEARLESAGYARYEISSYARPGWQAVHNRRYWERVPVLGLGMGAVSTDPSGEGAPFGIRRFNARRLETYLEAALTRRSAEGEPAEVLGLETARGEAVFLALRTAAGLDTAAFAAEFGAPPREVFAQAIEELVGRGLLAEAEDRLCLTRRGRLLSDSVFARFV